MSRRPSSGAEQGAAAVGRRAFARVEGAWPLALAVLVHVLAVRVLFHTVYTIGFSGTGLYFDDASRVVRGLLPYRDFTLEYPPFALVFFLLPRVAAPQWWTYTRHFQLEFLAADVAVLLMLWDIGRRRGGSRDMLLLLGVYTLGFLAVGPIVEQQYDIFPAALSLGALYCYWLGRHRTTWALLALGTMTKVYPLLLVPLIAMYEWRLGDRRRLRAGAIVFVATCVAVLLPFLVASPLSLVGFSRYHGERGIQLESTYASLLLLADHLGLSFVSIRFGFGAFNVVSPLASAVARVSPLVMGALLAAAYVRAYRTLPARSSGGQLSESAVGERSGSAIDLSWFSTASLLVLAMGLLGSKVLSPQYLIWLLPLVPLAAGRHRVSLWITFVIAAGLTYYIFPLRYDLLLAYRPSLIVALLARNALLGVLAYLAATSLDREAPRFPLA